MYAQEDNGPSSAPWFLDRSRLVFSERGPACKDESVYDGPWTATATRKLGLLVRGGSRWRYQTQETLLCRRSGLVFLATEHTRPYNSNRPPGLHRDEGFYLSAKLDRGDKGGMPFTKRTSSREFVTDAPVYYDDGELFSQSGSAKNPRQAYISYWFFYPFNDAPRAGVLFNHQGDWENISLLFQQDAGGSLVWTLRRSPTRPMELPKRSVPRVRSPLPAKAFCPVLSPEPNGTGNLGSSALSPMAPTRPTRPPALTRSALPTGWPPTTPPRSPRDSRGRPGKPSYRSSRRAGRASAEHGDTWQAHCFPSQATEPARLGQAALTRGNANGSEVGPASGESRGHRPETEAPRPGRR